MNESIKKEELQKQLDAIPPYPRAISTAMVVLGEAIAAALNLRDRPVLEEMKRLALDMFEQAESILKDQKQGLQ